MTWVYDWHLGVGGQEGFGDDLGQQAAVSTPQKPHTESSLVILTNHF